jgi:hypothetical protein
MLAGAITPKVFASSSPGFLPWDVQRRFLITPKALANTFGGVELRRRFPSVVAALQRWAEIRERLRRKNAARETTTDELATQNSQIA